MGAAAVAAVESGGISERDVGCLLAPTIDVDTVADNDDGSFVVLVDNWSPDLLRASALIVGLVDPLLLDSEYSLSASRISFLFFRELYLGGMMHQFTI